MQQFHFVASMVIAFDIFPVNDENFTYALWRLLSVITSTSGVYSVTEVVAKDTGYMNHAGSAFTASHVARVYCTRDKKKQASAVHINDTRTLQPTTHAQ